MNNNTLQNSKKRNCEGQIILPFLPEWYCYLCRQNKVEKPLVKGYLGSKREKQPDKILNLHLTCTLFIPELHLYFSSQDGFEAFNISKVQTEEYQCFYCQDSGNPKKGYSIKCREEACNNKSHLACIKQTRIYKQENDKKLLKCFTLCRQHARSNPQPHEITYDKLSYEIQNEWILVYKQLEEQEKQRQLQEKEQQALILKGKGGVNKRNNSQGAANSNVKQLQQAKLQSELANKSRNNGSKNSIHNAQEQFTEVSQGNQQSETSGIGINSVITSTAVDIYQDSHSQNIQGENDSFNDSRKKRRRPSKRDQIQSFQSKNQQEGMSHSGEKCEIQDSTIKKVFMETSQEIVTFRRDQPVCSPFDVSTIGTNNRDDELISPTRQDRNKEESNNITSNFDKETQQENAYTLLFGRIFKQEDKASAGSIQASTVILSQQQTEEQLLKSQSTPEETLDNNNAASAQCRRSSRQEMYLQNKKNDRFVNVQQKQKLNNKRGNSFDATNSTTTLGNGISQSIYDNPFNKILLHHEDITDDNSQNKQGIIRNNRSASHGGFSNKPDEKEVIEIEDEEEQYLECGYPNYNDDNRQQNMEQWWFNIDSEYFSSPQNPSSIIQDMLITLDIKQDFLVQNIPSTKPLSKQNETSKKKHSVEIKQYQLFYPKQIKTEQIEEICKTSVADLYLKCFQKNNESIDESYGYQMEYDQIEEFESSEELSKSEEIIQKIQTPLKGLAKKEQQKSKRKTSTKKEQQEITTKELKKSRSNKQDQNRSQNFDSQLLIKNLRDSTSCKENNEENMLIVDCDDNYKEEPEKEAKIEEENIEGLQQSEQNLQKNSLFQILDEEQQCKSNVVNSDGSMEIENDIFKDSNSSENKKQPENTQNEIIQKKEEENDLELKMEIVSEPQIAENKEIKIEDSELTHDQKLKESEVELQEIKKEEEYFENSQIKIEERPYDLNEKYQFPQPYQVRQKSTQVKQQEDKHKYIHYYQPEYIQEPLPLKINKKFTVLFHSVNGDGFLMVYDVNENADIKRSLTAKNKSEYSVCGNLQETQKLAQFLDIYKQTTAPGIDENNRRRAIPTSDTTPQLMFSKIIHLDKDALNLGIQEQIELNKHLHDNSSRRRKTNNDSVDYMFLRNILFEKQWCMNSKRFIDWQTNVYKQIDEDKDITYLKKQSILIWDILKLSQTKKNVIIGYADKEEYNTEIYFMVSSDDDHEHDRHNAPTKRLSTLPIKETQDDEQNENKQTDNLMKDNQKQEQNIQVENKENLFNEQQQVIENKSEILIEKQDQENQQDILGEQHQNEQNQLDQQKEEGNNKIEEEEENKTTQPEHSEDQMQLQEGIQTEAQQQEMKEQITPAESRKCSEYQESSNIEHLVEEKIQIEGQSEQHEDQSLKIGQDSKVKRKGSLIKKNTQLKKLDITEEILQQQQKNKREDGSLQIGSEQKSKLRARKPAVQQPQKLSTYMRNKQKMLGLLPQGDNSKQPPVKASTIFETLRKVKTNPLSKKMKKNPSFKQKDQLETDCMICFSQKNTDNNPVVYCSDCQQSFHKICYGIDEVPEGKFFCDKCDIIKTLRHKERYQRDMLNQRFSCPLCVETDLPIKLIYQKQSNHYDQQHQRQYDYARNGHHQANGSEDFRKNIEPSITLSQIEPKLNNQGELWMHPFCMFTFNLAKYDNGKIILKSNDFPTPKRQSNRDYLRSDSSISSEDIFSNVQCQICQRNHGNTIKCSEDECDEYFHPLCAFFQGLQCKLIEKDISKQNIQNQNYVKEGKKNSKNLKNTQETQMDLEMIDFQEKEQLQFQIRCKKHIILKRISIEDQATAATNQLMEEEINKVELPLEIKRIQQNLKQDVDYYLKQIFYRRFGVNYEKICTNFYYYEDFHQEVYSKNNIKVKFYNPHSDEYQSLSELLSFIQFGPQDRNQQQSHPNTRSSNLHFGEVTNSKNLGEDEELEYDMEQDYDEYEDEEEQERNDEHEMEEEEEEEDEEEELNNQRNKRGYKQKHNVKKQGESVLQPVQTYRKPPRYQRQKQQIQQEEDSSDNQSSQPNNHSFNKNSYKIIDEEYDNNKDKQLPQQKDLDSKQVQNTHGNQSNQQKAKQEVEEDVFEQYQLESDADYDSYHEEYNQSKSNYSNNSNNSNNKNVNNDENNNNSNNKVEDSEGENNNSAS